LLLIQLDQNKAPDRAPKDKAIVTIWSKIEWTTAHGDQIDEAIVDELMGLAEPDPGKIGDLLGVSHVNHWVRDLNEPLFFFGDFVAGGIEAATISGLDACRNIGRFLTQ